MTKNTVTIVRDTHRGTSHVKVRAGTRVTVLASRRDDDGVKLLVAIGKGTGRRFQVRADDTDYHVEQTVQVCFNCERASHGTPATPNVCSACGEELVTMSRSKFGCVWDLTGLDEVRRTK